MSAKAVNSNDKCFKSSKVVPSTQITTDIKSQNYSPRSRLEIEQMVKKIRDQYNISNEYPLQVVKFANKLGFRVFTAEFNDPNIYGAISIKENQKIIYVNIKDSLIAQRYIVAHELAHYFLHMQAENDNKDKINEIIDMYYSLEYNDYEAEADMFAEALLMDKDKITTKYKDISKSQEFKLNKKIYSKSIYKQSLLLKLSQYFGVGTKKIGSRLNTLGLLDNA